MKTEPAHEIAPDHRITVPIYSQCDHPVPDEVREINRRAEQQINAHKHNFIKLCLESLFPEEELEIIIIRHANQPEAYIPALVAKLDATKLKLTLRNDMSPTIILPSNHHPEKSGKHKGLNRHTGHTLQFHYADQWLGTMEIQYKHDGRIAIDITTRNETMSTHP